MERLDLSGSETADVLGYDPKNVARFQNNTLEIPRTVALACWALEYGAPRDSAPYTPTGRSRRVGEPKT